jgi:hypothetical protein
VGPPRRVAISRPNLANLPVLSGERSIEGCESVAAVHDLAVVTDEVAFGAAFALSGVARRSAVRAIAV